MPQRRLGDMLRQRREQLGYSLESASYATNIRMRVLSIFEESDYGNYPPRGHVQGMLSSYATFLGIEARLALEMYEREMEEHRERSEIETAASRTRSGRGRFGERRETSSAPKSRLQRSGETGSLHTGNKLAQEQMARNDDRYKSGSVRVVNSRPSRQAPRRFSDRTTTRGARPYYPQAQANVPRITSAHEPGDDAARLEGRGRLSATRAASTGSRTGAADGERNRYGYGSDRDARADEHNRSSKSSRRSRRSTDSPVENGGGTGIVATVIGVVSPVFKETRTRLIALAALLIVIIVIIAAHMLISSAGDNEAGIIEVNGGAENTTTTDTSSKGATATIKTTNGNPVSVHIEVAEGQTSLVNVSFDDDEAYKGIAVGPWSRDFQVSESMSATFGNPDAVTVTENGTEVQIEKNSDGSGVLTLKIESKSTAKE